MARTYLDDLEDYIIKHWHDDYPGPTRLLRDGLGSAFRHGVEQSFEYINNREGASRAVQPAPAGEKCTCGGMIGAILGKAGPTVHRTDGPCFMDRRSGHDRRSSPSTDKDRRKG